MKRDLIIAVPGPWKDRKEFIARVVTSSAGEFMLADQILAAPKVKDHVELELYEADPNMRKAEYAGLGRIGASTLDAIGSHVNRRVGSQALHSVTYYPKCDADLSRALGARRR